MSKITRDIGEHGQAVMFLDGVRIPSVSGLFKALGVDADLSKVPVELLERAVFIGNETHKRLEELEKEHFDSDVQGCLNSFHKWHEKNKCEHLIYFSERTEAKEINGQYLQARIDAMFMIDGVKVAVDYKTGSKIYKNNKVQVTAQKIIFETDKCATLQLFKDGNIAKLEYWNEEKLLFDMLAIYRDNDDLDRVLKGQALFNDGEEIPSALAEEYAFIEKELAILTKKEKELKSKIAKLLGNQKGSFENDTFKLKFDFVAGRETMKYDIDEMIMDGIDAVKYLTVKKGNGYYKTSVKEIKQ